MASAKVRNAHKESKRAKSEHPFAHSACSFLFSKLSLRCGLGFEFGLKLTLGLELGLKFGLGFGLGLAD